MKKAEEVMGDFMRTWKNMLKYQEVRLNINEPNYDEFEKAFSKEKKIVATIEPKEINQIEDKEDYEK